MYSYRYLAHPLESPLTHTFRTNCHGLDAAKRSDNFARTVQFRDTRENEIGTQALCTLQTSLPIASTLVQPRKVACNRCSKQARARTNRPAVISQSSAALQWFSIKTLCYHRPSSSCIAAPRLRSWTHKVQGRRVCAHAHLDRNMQRQKGRQTDGENR